MLNHIKNGLTEKQKEDLFELVQRLNPYWFTPKYKGSPYKYKMANVGIYGWYTEPNRYEVDHDGVDFLEIPDSIVKLAQEHGLQNPQALLINKYIPGKGKLGLHQDKDEKKRSPIVSLTLGCSGNFITAKSYDGEKTTHKLSHGDIFVFGEQERMIYHGIDSVDNDHDLGYRLNFTLREVK